MNRLEMQHKLSYAVLNKRFAYNVHMRASSIALSQVFFLNRVFHFYTFF